MEFDSSLAMVKAEADETKTESDIESKAERTEIGRSRLCWIRNRIVLEAFLKSRKAVWGTINEIEAKNEMEFRMESIQLKRMLITT